MDLLQIEATQLFELKKTPVKNVVVDFPLQGEGIEIELQNDTGRIRFQADTSRRNVITNKITYQLRHKKIFILRRLDIGGSHKNPPLPAPDPIFEPYADYEFRLQDHVHFYFEGYGERWALPLSTLTEIGIDTSDDMIDKMIKFFAYCNVENLNIKRVLTL